ncbi:hypothetical protein V9T40_000179 [Parthenolecanium corni]|uniref:Uncharacterized protein n=1 Tax=Parthenolecanium corni TaxID=536013 RepID=A0AAN9Y1C5_9HEMI
MKWRARISPLATVREHPAAIQHGGQAHQRTSRAHALIVCVTLLIRARARTAARPFSDSPIGWRLGSPAAPLPAARAVEASDQPQRATRRECRSCSIRHSPFAISTWAAKNVSRRNATRQKREGETNRNLRILVVHSYTNYEYVYIEVCVASRALARHSARCLSVRGRPRITNPNHVASPRLHPATDSPRRVASSRFVSPTRRPSAESADAFVVRISNRSPRASYLPITRPFCNFEPVAKDARPNEQRRRTTILGAALIRSAAVASRRVVATTAYGRPMASRSPRSQPFPSSPFRRPRDNHKAGIVGAAP